MLCFEHTRKYIKTNYKPLTMSFNTIINNYPSIQNKLNIYTSSSKTYLLTYTQTLRIKIEIHLDLVMSVQPHHFIKIILFLNYFIVNHNNHFNPNAIKIHDHCQISD